MDYKLSRYESSVLRNMFKSIPFLPQTITSKVIPSPKSISRNAGIHDFLKNYEVEDIGSATMTNPPGISRMFDMLTSMLLKIDESTFENNKQHVWFVIFNESTKLVKFMYCQPCYPESIANNFFHAEERVIKCLDQAVTDSTQKMYIFIYSQNSPCMFRGRRMPCLNILQQKCLEWEKDGHLVFVGFKKEWGVGPYRSKSFDSHKEANQWTDLHLYIKYKNLLKFKICFSDQQVDKIRKLVKDINPSEDVTDQFITSILEMVMIKVTYDEYITLNFGSFLETSQALINKLMDTNVVSQKDLLDEIFPKWYDHLNKILVKLTLGQITTPMFIHINNKTSLTEATPL